jgi:hypothetical protein
MQRVSVMRHSVGIYQWALTDGSEVIHESDEANESIEECLADASEHVLDDPLIEISYRGVTAGTIPVSRLVQDPAGVATWVVGAYAALAQWIPGFDEL